MSIQMELYKIIISEMAEQQIIWLKEVDGERKFPIVIGNPEAMAIDRRLKGHVHPRPLTHDLLANVIAGFPTASQVERHPNVCTAYPTSGKAAMNPMLIATL